MVLKLRQLSEQLGALGDSVKADEVLSRLKAAKQGAVRGLRDRADLFADGANLIKLGHHRFSVNTRPLELTIVPRGDGMAVHLTGTDYHEPVDDAAFNETRPYWSQLVVSETDDVYRGEHLAASVLFDAEAGRAGLTIPALQAAALRDGGLVEVVRAYAADRYDEGYDRGVHDADAALILGRVLALRSTAGLLRFPSRPRAIAVLFWAWGEALRAAPSGRKDTWARQARSLGRLRTAFAAAGTPGALQRLADTLSGAIAAFTSGMGIADWTEAEGELAGRYLAEELMAERPRFAQSADALALRDALLSHLDGTGGRTALDDDLRALERDPAERLAVARSWMAAFLELAPELTPDRAPQLTAASHALDEAVVALLVERAVDTEPSHATTSAEVDGLLGQHPRIRERRMTLRLDEFLARLADFRARRVPGFQAFRRARQVLVERERHRLRLDEFKPRVMTAFVRNRLINEVYLPLIGNNLAKQMGAEGDNKRTDLMGLLLLISPPGYGKTTLMEYVAAQLGLVFMKVNGPSLGHEVTSLDPSEAPNATARQEVDKINLALEMGNNVMLYLDDIQHTNPELLQKFISLCDASRRVEGVWKGRRSLPPRPHGGRRRGAHLRAVARVLGRRDPGDPGRAAPPVHGSAAAAQC